MPTAIATTREYFWLPSNDTSNDTMAESMGMAANDNGAVDLPLAVIEGTTTTHIHSDHLGRPVRMTDAAKATVWQATYKPFGEVQSITGTLAQNLRFPGQYFQIETGLAYNWHRHYDAITGRYTQADPLRFVDGPSIYQYAMASPFMLIDRAGMAILDNRSSSDVAAIGTPGQGHGHIFFPPGQDPYIRVTIPPGKKVDRCNPVWGKGPDGKLYPVYDLDAIDFDGDGTVRGSPYDPSKSWLEWLNDKGKFLDDKVPGGDDSHNYTALDIWPFSKPWILGPTPANVPNPCPCPY